MYSTKSLFKVIKCQTILMGVIFGLRAAVAFDALFGPALSLKYYRGTFAIALFVGLTLGLVMAWLCSNIWATKGMLAIHYMVSLIVSDAAAFIIWKLMLKGNRESMFFGLWMDGAFSVIFFMLLMVYGFFNVRKVVRHTLSCHTPKIQREFRIAFLSDLHFGTIQPEEILMQTVERINAEEPDMVLITGDIAEEATPGDRLPVLFDMLAGLKSRHGTFFVHGNHDRQEELHGEGRTYTDAEFDSLMEKAGIKCIDDELIVLDGGIALQGRNDYSYKDRMSVEDVAKGLPKDKFTIVMEHQPIECEELAKAGADLCLAGHLHGAPNWTNNIVYKLSRMYYNGLYKVGDMQLYVNAGLTGSRYPVRTHSHCEYVIINITK